MSKDLYQIWAVCLSLLLFSLLVSIVGCGREEEKEPKVYIATFSDREEAERLLKASAKLSAKRRVIFLSKYFKGRKYRPDTKKRIKKQRSKPKTKKEATNKRPQPIKTLSTSFTYLDCMTYVEHVLALAATKENRYECFLHRLVDVMCDSKGLKLMNHHRSHFTSHWADVNERKGYLRNVARGHKKAAQRTVMLNRVGENRTFYIEDSFMISTKPKVIHYFPSAVILAGEADLKSGDILAMVCNKEGLDVLHMAFYVEEAGKKILRHASYKKNLIVDDDFEEYVRKKTYVKGLMVLRPILQMKEPAPYQFRPRKR